VFFVFRSIFEGFDYFPDPDLLMILVFGTVRLQIVFLLGYCFGILRFWREYRHYEEWVQMQLRRNQRWTLWSRFVLTTGKRCLYISRNNTKTWQVMSLQSGRFRNSWWVDTDNINGQILWQKDWLSSHSLAPCFSNWKHMIKTTYYSSHLFITIATAGVFFMTIWFRNWKMFDLAGECWHRSNGVISRKFLKLIQCQMTRPNVAPADTEVDCVMWLP